MLIRGSNEEIFELKVGDKVYWTTSDFEYNGVTGCFENNLENYAIVEIDKDSVIADESEFIVEKCNNGGCYGFYSGIVTEIHELHYENVTFSIQTENVAFLGMAHYKGDEEWLEIETIVDEDGFQYAIDDIEKATETECMLNVIEKEVENELDEILQALYDGLDIKIKYGTIKRERKNVLQ